MSKPRSGCTFDPTLIPTQRHGVKPERLSSEKERKLARVVQDTLLHKIGIDSRAGLLAAYLANTKSLPDREWEKVLRSETNMHKATSFHDPSKKKSDRKTIQYF